MMFYDLNREDLLELTRRMTVKRSCIFRAAGAYMDKDGEVDGSFNTGFLKLSDEDKDKNLSLAKSVLFGKTNEEVRGLLIPQDQQGPGSIFMALNALKSCELKNDALLYDLYEVIGQKYHSTSPYSIRFYYGCYDIPRKGSDKAEQWESEDTYSFLICLICDIDSNYEPGEVRTGLLFPAYLSRSAAPDLVAVYKETIGDLLFN